MWLTLYYLPGHCVNSHHQFHLFPILTRAHRIALWAWWETVVSGRVQYPHKEKGFELTSFIKNKSGKHWILKLTGQTYPLWKERDPSCCVKPFYAQKPQHSFVLSNYQFPWNLGHWSLAASAWGNLVLRIEEPLTFYYSQNWITINFPSISYWPVVCRFAKLSVG